MATVILRTPIRCPLSWLAHVFMAAVTKMTITDCISAAFWKSRNLTNAKNIIPKASGRLSHTS